MSTLLATDQATQFGAEVASHSEKAVAEYVAKEAVLKAMESERFTTPEDLKRVYQGAFSHAVNERKMFSHGRTS